MSPDAPETAADAVPSFRDRLREAARPEPDVSPLDPERVPDEPLELFRSWLDEAIDGGVVQPHAFVLATTSTASGPTARTVLLKDLDEAFWFASSVESPKGVQMTEDDRVALAFTWEAQGRQVRVLGTASAGPRDVAEADFLHRHPDTRAAAIAVPQSAEFDPDEADAALRAARTRLDADPDLVPADWTAWRVDPVSVEFWQASTGRDQVRVRYERVGDDWRRASLWP